MSTDINQLNLKSGVLNKYKNDIFDNKYWHKIIVENVEGLDREAVLRTIMKFCHPLHFIPVSYKSSNNTANFLMKNCGEAIERMCNHNLSIANPFNTNKPFIISIKLCFASANSLKINIEENALKVLNKRFNSKIKLLNLENFAKDPDLEEYCPLSQPKLLFYILHLAKNLEFKTLKLGSNDIESLKPLEALAGKTFKIVDLRNNNIKSILEISYLRDFDITELFLDGNPICNKYDEFTYGRAIKEHLVYLKQLDRVKIDKEPNTLTSRRNFLCNYIGYDLVDQFLEHYFTLYDEQRSLLNVMYHREALFSLTCNYLTAQSTSSNARLSVYKIFSRNLLQMSNASQNIEFLFAGPDQIMRILNSLPTTQHDPYSFTADLIMYTKEIVILVVGGLYRELPLEEERLLNFTRTFILVPGQNGEYLIINEMMYISNATTEQAAESFKFVKLLNPNHFFIPQPQNVEEKDEIAKALTTVTGMNMIWSRKCLEECNYDLSKALTLFVDLFKIDKIPSIAFDRLPDFRSPENDQVKTENISLTRKNKRPRRIRLRLPNGTMKRMSLAYAIKNNLIQLQSSSKESPNTGQQQDGGKESNIQTILNQPHEYGGTDSAQNANIAAPATVNMPSIGSVRPTAPNIGPIPTNFGPRNILPGNIQPFNPPNAIMPMHAPGPLVPHMRNIVHPTLNLRGSMLGNIPRVIPPTPVIRTNIQTTAKQKKNSRGGSLVNINLKK